MTVDIDDDRAGGCVANDSNAVAEWVSEFLAGEERSDVRDKLDRSDSLDRHAFVILSTFSKAPFAATDPLTRDDAPAPTVLPTLPAEITHVWAMSTWSSGWGFRWSPMPVGWQRFSKDPETSIGV